MSLEYTISNGQSQGSVDVNSFVQQLQGQGVQVQGVSADGSSIIMVGSDGKPFDVPTESAFQQLGWQISNVKPSNADYGHVNSDWRAAINLLPADEHRRAYIEGQLKRSGVQNSNIVGSGRDWFAFDPESNRYVALTNSPDWDRSDAMEAAVKMPRFLGSAIGAAAGGILGGGITPAAVAGTAGGAALGGALGDIPTRYLMAQRDPQLKEIMSQNLGDIGWDVAKESALDATFAGMVPAAGMVAKPVYNVLAKGPVSTAARALGTTAEAGGRILNKAAGAIDVSPMGKELASTFIPGAGEMVGAGWLGQMPGMAIRGSAKGVGSLGESQFMKEAFPEAAQQMRLLSHNLLRKAKGPSNITNEMSRGAEEIGGFLSGIPKTRSAMSGKSEHILGNLGEIMGGGGEYRKQLYKSYREARAMGVPADVAMETARINVQEPAKMVARRELGRKIGRGLQNIEDFSRGVERVGTGITSGVLKGTSALGYGVGKSGSLLKMGGSIAQPLEAKSALRYGAEEFYRPYLERGSTWQDPRKKAKMLIASEEY